MALLWSKAFESVSSSHHSGNRDRYTSQDSSARGELSRLFDITQHGDPGSELGATISAGFELMVDRSCLER